MKFEVDRLTKLMKAIQDTNAKERRDLLKELEARKGKILVLKAEKTAMGKRLHDLELEQARGNSEREPSIRSGSGENPENRVTGQLKRQVENLTKLVSELA